MCAASVGCSPSASLTLAHGMWQTVPFLQDESTAHQYARKGRRGGALMGDAHTTCVQWAWLREQDVRDAHGDAVQGSGPW